MQILTLLVFMGHMCINPCLKFHGFAPVSENDRIIQNQNFNPLWLDQGTESNRYFSCKEQNDFFG